MKKKICQDIFLPWQHQPINYQAPPLPFITARKGKGSMEPPGIPCPKTENSSGRFTSPQKTFCLLQFSSSKLVIPTFFEFLNLYWQILIWLGDIFGVFRHNDKLPFTAKNHLKISFIWCLWTHIPRWSVISLFALHFKVESSIVTGSHGLPFTCFFANGREDKRESSARNLQSYTGKLPEVNFLLFTTN